MTTMNSNATRRSHVPAHHAVLIGMYALAMSACFCGGEEPGPVGGSGIDERGVTCVWNQAYQENYDEDKPADIIANANSCYVLTDPFGSQEVRDGFAAMHDEDNTIGCYISSGTCEDWRDDYEAMRPYCVTKEWGEWAGEFFVDNPGPQLQALMMARLDALEAWGCDMVEFDNMDWAFDEDARAEFGFSATPEQAIAYNNALCDYTRSLGMGCMAKNTTEGSEDFDGGTFESYPEMKDWWDHDDLQGLLDDDKLVVVVHYDESDCEAVRAEYGQRYSGADGAAISFICEE